MGQRARTKEFGIIRMGEQCKHARGMRDQ